MSALQNFPIISQLTSTSGDGSSPNSSYDCVPTCLVAGAMYLNGIEAMNAEYNPDAFLDMAYPEGYIGATDAAKYVAPLTKLGIALSPMTANPAHLVALIHQQIEAGHPVICTVPDVYVPASYGWTHALCAHADAPGQITLLDPYIGKDITKTDAELTALLQFNQIWSMEKLQEAPKPMGIPGWHDDGATLTDPGGGKAVLGFRQKILDLYAAGQWNENDWIQGPGEQYYTQRLEASNAELGDGDQLITRLHMLCYPHNPTGAVAHLKNTVVVEYCGTELAYTRQQYANIYAAYQKLQAQVAAQPQSSSAQSTLAHLAEEAASALGKKLV